MEESSFIHDVKTLIEEGEREKKKIFSVTLKGLDPGFDLIL